jgi:hypothetical protein
LPKPAKAKLVYLVYPAYLISLVCLGYRKICNEHADKGDNG